MGNKQQQKEQTRKLQLSATTERIIIHSNFKMTLDLCSIDCFPHGLDGLRLWQAGIVLARYVVQNNAIFKNKNVLQLGGGVGIAGLAAKKWTEAMQVDITDYHPSVIENIKRNMHKNKLECPVYELDWTKHQVTQKRYDIIMGSDVVYFGCPVADLYQVFKEKLEEKGGIGIIVIPVRKNYATLFVEKVEKDQFQLEIQKLEKEQYFEPPLQDEKEGLRKFPLLKEIDFEVYKLIRK